ncbi:MAG: PH domain-containing protein [Anaerolineales bacterium]|nr:PH domain-containing protein [Anaerolineales bacterium]
MEPDREFRPHLIPRSGERNAWLLTLLAVVAWLVMRLNFPDYALGALILVILLALSAVSISLGNWMDRQTLLALKPEGLSYRNGLRHLELQWDEIESVRVFSDRWGERVQVRAAGNHFVFRTLSEIHYKGELRGQMGFTAGDQILREIIRASQLQQQDADGENVRYYARP